MFTRYRLLMWGTYHVTLDTAMALKPEADWTLPVHRSATTALAALFERVRANGITPEMVAAAAKPSRAKYAGMFGRYAEKA